MDELHPDQEIAALFRQLREKLCQWERSTGRESMLIFREVPGNLCQHPFQRPDVVHRWQNGVSLDPANADMNDEWLLEPFSQT